MRKSTLALTLKSSSLILLLAANVGCGAPPTPSPDVVDRSAYMGACYQNVSGLQNCLLVLAYRGALTGPTLAESCAMQSGELRAACPPEGRVGRCTVDNGLSRSVLNYYGGDAMAVRDLCARAGGVFEAD